MIRLKNDMLLHTLLDTSMIMIDIICILDNDSLLVIL